MSCIVIFGTTFNNTRAELAEIVVFLGAAYGTTFSKADGSVSVQVLPTGRGYNEDGRPWRRHLSTSFIVGAMLHEVCHALIRAMTCVCGECQEERRRCGGHVGGWAFLARAVEERAQRVLGLTVGLGWTLR